MGTDLYNVSLEGYEPLTLAQAQQRAAAVGLCPDVTAAWFKKAEAPLVWVKLALRNTYDKQALPQSSGFYLRVLDEALAGGPSGTPLQERYPKLWQPTFATGSGKRRSELMLLAHCAKGRCSWVELLLPERYVRWPDGPDLKERQTWTGRGSGTRDSKEPVRASEDLGPCELPVMTVSRAERYCTRGGRQVLVGGRWKKVGPKEGSSTLHGSSPGPGFDVQLRGDRVEWVQGDQRRAVHAFTPAQQLTSSHPLVQEERVSVCLEQGLLTLDLEGNQLGTVPSEVFSGSPLLVQANANGGRLVVTNGGELWEEGADGWTRRARCGNTTHLLVHPNGRAWTWGFGLTCWDRAGKQVKLPATTRRLNDLALLSNGSILAARGNGLARYAADGSCRVPLDEINLRFGSPVRALAVHGERVFGLTRMGTVLVLDQLQPVALLNWQVPLTGLDDSMHSWLRLSHDGGLVARSGLATFRVSGTAIEEALGRSRTLKPSRVGEPFQ